MLRKTHKNDVSWGIVRHGYLRIEDFAGETHMIPVTEDDLNKIEKNIHELRKGMKEFQSIEVKGCDLKRCDKCVNSK